MNKSMNKKNIERFGSIFDQEDYETEKEGWKALLWVLPAIIFISYIIARIVATVVWGV